MALDVVEATGRPAGTVAGFTAHGSAEPRGQSAAPLSVLFEGRFGPMFRDPTIKIVPHGMRLIASESSAARSSDNDTAPANAAMPMLNPPTMTPTISNAIMPSVSTWCRSKWRTGSASISTRSARVKSRKPPNTK